MFASLLRARASLGLCPVVHAVRAAWVCRNLVSSASSVPGNWFFPSEPLSFASLGIQSGALVQRLQALRFDKPSAVQSKVCQS